MRRLLLLRHAKAERAAPAGGGDHERPLSARGRDDATTMGHYLVRHGLAPDLALVSTATRTGETWAAVAQTFDTTPHKRDERRIYDATPEALVDMLASLDDQAQRVMIVGHNPGMHLLAALLVASGDLDARQRLEIEFPTASLAVIDFAFESWSRLHPQSGRLEQFVSPRLLSAATD